MRLRRSLLALVAAVGLAGLTACATTTDDTLCRQASPLAQQGQLAQAAELYARAQIRGEGTCASTGLTDVSSRYTSGYQEAARGSAAELDGNLDAARGAYESALRFDAGNQAAAGGLARLGTPVAQRYAPLPLPAVAPYPQATAWTSWPIVLPVLLIALVAVGLAAWALLRRRPATDSFDDEAPRRGWAVPFLGRRRERVGGAPEEGETLDSDLDEGDDGRPEPEPRQSTQPEPVRQARREPARPAAESRQPEPGRPEAREPGQREQGQGRPESGAPARREREPRPDEAAQLRPVDATATDPTARFDQPSRRSPNTVRTRSRALDQPDGTTEALGSEEPDDPPRPPTPPTPAPRPAPEAPTPGPTAEAPNPAPTAEAPTHEPTAEGPTHALTAETPTPSPTTDAPAPGPITAIPAASPPREAAGPGATTEARQPDPPASAPASRPAPAPAAAPTPAPRPRPEPQTPPTPPAAVTTPRPTDPQLRDRVQYHDLEIGQLRRVLDRALRTDASGGPASFYVAREEITGPVVGVTLEIASVSREVAVGSGAREVQRRACVRRTVTDRPDLTAWVPADYPGAPDLRAIASTAAARATGRIDDTDNRIWATAVRTQQRMVMLDLDSLLARWVALLRGIAPVAPVQGREEADLQAAFAAGGETSGVRHLARVEALLSSERPELTNVRVLALACQVASLTAAESVERALDQTAGLRALRPS